jgi:NDP-sugar pyrophosphorylase family protein
MADTADSNTDLTAIILCGGKGERLKPFTDAVPKPMVPLYGRPLLEHLMNYLSSAGIRQYVLCVGYKSEQIERFVHDRSDKCCQVRCVNSGDASMVDRILDATEYVTGPVLICYGDTLANVDICALRSSHRKNRALVTITTYRLHSPFGIVEIHDDGRVSSFAEKPVLPHWINIGFMLCEPTGLKLLSHGSDLPGWLSKLASEKSLFAYRHEGRHLTINTEKDRVNAEAEMVEFVTLMDDVKV